MIGNASSARIWRAIAVAAALFAAGAAQTAWATVILVDSRAALGTPKAVVDWGSLGGDLTAVTPPAQVGPVTVGGAAAFTVFEEGANGSFFSDFAEGDRVLSLFDLEGAGDIPGVFDIRFATPVRAVGTQIQSFLYGTFLVDLTLYDQFDAKIASFLHIEGVNTENGDGTALFVGAVSDADNIARMVLAGAGDGAAINAIIVPEPPTLLLTLTLLGLLSAARRPGSQGKGRPHRAVNASDSLEQMQ